MKTITHSEQETRDFAKKFATQLKGGDILCLYGELGAGKTTFVKGLADGLGIAENITSPTFALMNVYIVIPAVESPLGRGRGGLANVHEPTPALRPPRPSGDSGMTIKKLIHLDTYRLKDEKELIVIGAEDYFGAPNAITVIEWPEKMEDFLREKKLIKIFLNHASNNKREITVQD